MFKRFTLLTLLSSTLLIAPAFAETLSGDRPDLNGDGKITEDEALTLARSRFDIADINQDGMVSVEEMELAALRRFAAHDTDGDGEISRKEIRKNFMANR